MESIISQVWNKNRKQEYNGINKVPDKETKHNTTGHVEKKKNEYNRPMRMFKYLKHLKNK